MACPVSKARRGEEALKLVSGLGPSPKINLEPIQEWAISGEHWWKMMVIVSSMNFDENGGSAPQIGISLPLSTPVLLTNAAKSR